MGEDVLGWVHVQSASYPIRPNSKTRIGRSIDSDIRLFFDTSVSREHCVIEASDDRVEIKDLNSRNGVKINGELISGSAQLQAGDVISLGESDMKFLVEPGDLEGSTELLE